MARNREEHLKAKREGMARLRAMNPGAARRKRNEFYAKNREAQKAKMRAYAKRRFFWNREMHLRGENRASASQLSAIWKTQRGLCALTGRRLDRTSQLDHIVPRSRGGGDGLGNLRWVCATVNMAKRDMTDAEFISLCSEAMRWIGQRIQQVDSMGSTPSDAGSQ